MIIRLLDVIISVIGLVLISPLLLLISMIIISDSKGCAFYIQKRVGKNNVDFRLFKFRTMALNSENEGSLTIGSNDHRITKIGYYLRKYKIDELLQLINVLIGDMSIVGPRPEVRKYVDLYSEEQKNILNVRPGITDYASIEYLKENEILASSENPERTYIEKIMPEKIQLNLKYINNPSFKAYINIIYKTIRVVLKA